ncbi:MFS transporter [Flavobacterium sp. PL02]|uniref:MFS transporter n=1 Tax=Flavobacterium sp. PL02 TaxID=3088354 RepID=UPI002B22ED12|nr:MFS transporter [Flavobacterium sp. PL02]MEA9412825.1 MFS transporter [Flavobacterium sp. PL02]
MKKSIVESTSFTPYQKFIIVILFLLQFTVTLDFIVISPLGDMLIKNLDMTTSSFGFVVSAYAFSAGMSGLLAAGFADKFDRKKILIFFYTGFIIGTIFCAISSSYLMLLIARIVTGLFGGVIGSISLAIVADLFLINQRGRVMAYIQMAFAASLILGIPVGVYFANNWGWHSAFIMIAGIGILILIAIVTQMQSINKHLEFQSSKNPFLHLWGTLNNKEYRIGFTAIALLSIGAFMLQPFGTAFMVNNLHISQLQLPMIFFLIGLSILIIMPLIGKLSDKFNKFKLFTIASLLSIIMVIIYTNLNPIALWEIVAITIVLYMAIMSRMIPASTLNTAIPEIKDRGAYMSVTSSLQQIAGGIAAVCAGFIVHQDTKQSPLENYDILGYVFAAITLCTIFLIWRVNQLVRLKNTLTKISQEDI